ncbi:cell adhesion molecule 4-like isoform X2 [Clupea harengus]|uniref:Cell adhesion molecule 4-like isoform X2 n=1 Tax=Clupea harengus TaxID=7950 RepID=A0A6P8GLZ1_CLUHA|nr:cell adhesion molecule 4-like isoform X2 [Clupea harengus]
MSVQRRHAMMIYLYLLLNFVLCEEGRIITPEGGTEAREYQCVADANSAPTSFVWRYQGQALPDGVRPEGDRLHFLELNSDLNGEYSCEVTNPYGTAVYSIYRHIVDPDDTHNEL